MTRTRIAVVTVLLLLAVGAVWVGWLLLSRANDRALTVCVPASVHSTTLSCERAANDGAALYESTALASVGTALLGAAVVLVLVDWFLGGMEGKAAQRLSESQQVARMMAQIRSGSHEFAMSAINELRSAGTLANGSLAGSSWAHAQLGAAPLDGAVLIDCDFSGADLTNSRLVKATLVGVDFADTRLDGANLCWADLTGATVLDKQLATADMLWNAVLPDGSRYDGRFNLEGDTAYARELGVDTSDPVSLEGFYGSHRA